MVLQRVMISIFCAGLLSSVSCFTTSDDGGGCTIDLDCKGDRVCSEAGVCVDPGTTDGGGGTTDGGGGTTDGGGGTTDGGGGTSDGGGGSNVTCPMSISGTVIGTKNEGPGNATASLVFDANGELVSLDGVSCTLDPSSTYLDSITWIECGDAYLCGACPIYVTADDVAARNWTMLNPGGAGCDSNSFDYLLDVPCYPDCSGKSCGDDGCGGSCGSCGGSESCWQGTCQCPSACQMIGSSVCCGPPFCGGDCVGNSCC